MRRRTGSPRTSKARAETRTALATVVEGRGAAGRIESGCVIRARRDGSAAPFVAALAHELPALVGALPDSSHFRIYGGSAHQMPSKTHEREVPSDAHSARAVLLPEIIRDVGDVFEPQACSAIR